MSVTKHIPTEVLRWVGATAAEYYRGSALHTGKPIVVWASINYPDNVDEHGPFTIRTWSKKGPAGSITRCDTRRDANRTLKAHGSGWVQIAARNPMPFQQFPLTVPPAPCRHAPRETTNAGGPHEQMSLF